VKEFKKNKKKKKKKKNHEINIVIEKYITMEFKLIDIERPINDIELWFKC